MLPVLKDIEAKHSKAGLGSVSSAITTITLEYVAAMCSTLIQVKNFDIEDWETVSPRSSHQNCSIFVQQIFTPDWLALRCRCSAESS